MKRYIKDNKVYFTPITIVDGDKKILTNSDEVIKKYGYTDYVDPKPSLESLIEASNMRINQETDRKILNDFVWNGKEFYLTMENQFNFKTMYDMRDYKEFPITIKTKSGFTQLEDMSALSGFYFAGVEFVENCLKEGWTKKAEEEEKIRESYK